MARVMVVAGELSGDGLAAPVVARLVARGHTVLGVGGPRCVGAGLRPLVAFEGLAAHGLGEAVGSLPALGRAWRALRGAILGVDLVLAVDFPELNRRLLERARGRVPFAWLAPPQAWAWRPWRWRVVAAADWVGCVLPHAAAWYRAQGVAALAVGHPLASAGPLPAVAAPAVALLPGSRGPTARRLLAVQLDAAARLRREWPEVAFHLGVAPGLEGLSVPPWVVIHAGAQAALAAAQVAWAGAGTATLEAALAGRPPLTLARLQPASEWLARRLVRLDCVGLPNLVLRAAPEGVPRLPELLLAECTPAAVARIGAGLLRDQAQYGPSLEAVRAALARPDWAGGVVEGLERLLRRDGGFGVTGFSGGCYAPAPAGHRSPKEGWVDVPKAVGGGTDL